MNTLFTVETDRLKLSWSQVQAKDPAVLQPDYSRYGRLRIKKRRETLEFGSGTFRAGFLPEVATDPEQEIGPILYEQTNYKLFVQSKTDQAVSVNHRDPVIEDRIDYEDGGRIALGFINFGAQIGRTEFSVLVGGQPEIDFEIEIFPSKLDYFSDYEQILAEVQEVFRGLAFEYLRSTYQKGAKVRVPQPTDIEWLVLLRAVAKDLEKALHHIAQHPIRSLTREPINMPVEKIRRVDSSVRAAVRRKSGAGKFITLKNRLSARSRVPARQARPTLDTPEHRWLATQLQSIRRRISRLRRQQAATQKDKKPTARDQQTLNELDALETRLIRVSRLEPIEIVKEVPPAGFASIQLLSAPGYREAYQACLVLALGLRIEGGPLSLSVKDLNLLYEYWCYIALLRIVAEVLDQPIPTSQLFTIHHRGLKILLQKGRQCSVPFTLPTGREITITYNPKFKGEDYLVPQQPDILMGFEDPGWPKLHLLFDAKYRVDASSRYQEQYGSPGPPQDALNVLHRYRDAILETDGIKSASKQSKHSVVQAAALFPFREKKTAAFAQSRLWKSIDRLGIGAIPLLPGDTQYLRQWLLSVLHQGGWALADQVIPHHATDHAYNWRIAASEAVLVGPLRSGTEQKHLDWIRGQRTYYMPLLKQQGRQYFTNWVAIYSPVALRQPGAITCYAQVESIEVKKRAEIPTPWPASRNGELNIVYHLGQLQRLDQPIENMSKSGQGQRFSGHRWTSKLALDRATVLSELFLETEPEWRLYENLQANNLPFRLKPGSVVVIDTNDPKGRTNFELEDGTRIRYGGAAGFIVKQPYGQEYAIAQVKDLVAKLVDG